MTGKDEIETLFGPLSPAQQWSPFQIDTWPRNVMTSTYDRWYEQNVGELVDIRSPAKSTTDKWENVALWSSNSYLHIKWMFPLTSDCIYYWMTCLNPAPHPIAYSSPLKSRRDSWWDKYFLISSTQSSHWEEETTGINRTLFHLRERESNQFVLLRLGQSEGNKKSLFTIFLTSHY